MSDAIGQWYDEQRHRASVLCRWLERHRQRCAECRANRRSDCRTFKRIDAALEVARYVGD